MDTIQMLTRDTQVGEYYIMGPPAHDPQEDTKQFMDMMIYDEEKDRHVMIKWEDAVEATCIDNGGLITGLGSAPFNMPGGVNSLTWKQKAGEWTGLNQKGFKSGAKPDTKVYVVVAKPFIQHKMHSAILCVAGQDTGRTLYGPSDMQLSANTQVKTIEGCACYFKLALTQTCASFQTISIRFLGRHYTGHFKSVITKPQNVFVLRDISCAGYVAGGGTKFFGTSATEVKQQLQRRLAMREGVDGSYKDMLAFPLTEEQFENGSMDTCISVTSRVLPWEVQSTGVGGVHNSFPGGEQSFKAYDEAFKLSSIHFGEDMKAAENQEFLTQGSTNNALCFIGPHRKYDPWSRSFMSLTPGQGHFGPDAIPGVRAALKPPPACPVLTFY